MDIIQNDGLATEVSVKHSFELLLDGQYYTTTENISINPVVYATVYNALFIMRRIFRVSVVVWLLDWRNWTLISVNQNRFDS